MRSFVPFGNPWKMPIPVPYSFLVKDENLAWTCGQIPVDDASDVLAPSDLIGQTEIVCDYIDSILGQAGLSSGALGKLVLYYVDQKPDDAERMLAHCRSRFGNRPVLIPVAVPYFYFDHMLLEVDAFAGAENGRVIERNTGNATVKLCDGGEHCWVSLTVEPGNLEAAKTLLELTLAEAGISADQRLCEHWVAAARKDDPRHLSQIAKILEQIGLISDPGALIQSADNNAKLTGELTYAKHTPALVEVQEVGGVMLVKRQIGRSTWFSLRSINASLSIVEQTRKIVGTLGDALHANGMDFKAIVKSTTNYLGGSTDDELFENMVIRNQCYASPGPASTGLPVAGFANDESHIIVDVVAVVDLPDPENTA